MAIEISELVEGLSKYTIFKVGDSPLSEASLISDNFSEYNLGGIVVDEGVIENPSETLELVFSNQREEGLFSQPVRDGVMLIENTEDGANFYYVADSPELESALVEVFGESVAGDAGNFLLRNFSEFKEVYADNIATEIEEEEIEEVAPVEEVESTGVVETAPADVVVTTNPVVTPVFTVLVIGIVLFTIFWKNPYLDFDLSKFFQSTPKKKSPEVETEYKVDLGDEQVELQVKELMDNISMHEELSGGYKENLSEELKRFYANFEKMINLARNSTEETFQRVAIEYSSVLERFNRLIGEEYWGKLVNERESFRAPRDAYTRQAEVREITKEVDESVVYNIQQFTESQTREFDIDLQMLSNNKRDIEKELL